MNNKIEVFKNEQFGEVRTILEGETLLFCGSDIAKALGYARPGKAIIDHCKGVLKRDTLTSGGTKPGNLGVNHLAVPVSAQDHLQGCGGHHHGQLRLHSFPRRQGEIHAQGNQRGAG